jgi:type II secretion system protein G
MKREYRAFTLIELLVVIAIIGLLASIVLVALNGARSKARDTTRLADIRELQSALELYFNDNSTYPMVVCDSTPGSPYPDGQAWAACWSAVLPSQYIGKMPLDPINADGQYGYYYYGGTKPNANNCGYYGTGSASDYSISTRLENPGSVPNSCAAGFGAFDNSNLNYVVGM